MNESARYDRRRLKIGRVGLLAGIGCAVLILQGCIPTAVMVDQALEGRAEDTRTFAGGPDEVYSATLAALRQLGVEVLKSFQDNVGADIDGTWPTGERLEVRLEQSGERQTVVRAQLGRRRNPEATGQLFNAIAGKLHSRP